MTEIVNCDSGNSTFYTPSLKATSEQAQEVFPNRGGLVNEMEHRLAALRSQLAELGQKHVLAGLASGDPSQRQSLLDQVSGIDLPLFRRALTDVERTFKGNSDRLDKHPIPPKPFPQAKWEGLQNWICSPDDDVPNCQKDDATGCWWREGLRLVADGEVAVLVLAGGQGTRLGAGAPIAKGMLELQVPQPKSLFQLQAERLLLVQDLASFVSHLGVVLIMDVHPNARKVEDTLLLSISPICRNVLFWVSISHSPEIEFLSPRGMIFHTDGNLPRVLWESLKVTGTGIKRQIPWIVMTSDATDAATRAFFEEKSYFGLEKSQVWFLKHSSLPCVDLNEGHAMLMETPWKVAMAGSGNGALFSALCAAGFVDKLSGQGVKYVQVYAVDNALARVADPVFYGFVHENQADVGVKVVSKKHAKESVGVVCLHQDATHVQRYGVIEYSEMPESMTTAKDDSGKLQFRAAHICINMFSVQYLEKLTSSNFHLEFHPAVKRIPHVRENSGTWEAVSPEKPNGIKLEQFIFDSFQCCNAEKVALLEVTREEEFAPIKNAIGPGVADTAATASELLLALKRKVNLVPPKGETMSEGFSLLKAYAGRATESTTSDLVNLTKSV